MHGYKRERLLGFILLAVLFIPSLWLGQGLLLPDAPQNSSAGADIEGEQFTEELGLLDLDDDILAEMSEQEILALIKQENERLKQEALRGTELEQFLRANKWRLKTKITTNLAQQTRHERMRNSFLREGFKFSTGDVLLLGKYEVERTWHVISKTSELFLDSGDDNAFELFDVSGFVYRTEDGFVLKKEVTIDEEEEDFDASVKWIEYHFKKSA